MTIDGSSILITGGTGSFGKQFVATLLERYPSVKRLVIFSRDELKQFEMAQMYPHERFPQIRFFLGDVRDLDRMRRALEGIEIVIHAAALKQVPAAEYNPMEFIKTNIIGAENVITASLELGVRRVVALSTDKAAAPINLYGATKLCSDKLFLAANNIKGGRDIRFSVVRYGNVMGSRGSVIPFFLARRATGVIPITHPEMTRFNIPLSEGVDLVLHAIDEAWGGELIVPKIPSYRILDLARAIAPECRTEIVGIRPGEKIHEEMITSSDSFYCWDLGTHYVILPTQPIWQIDDFRTAKNATAVPAGFQYNSGTNTEWLDVETLRHLIRLHVDPGFTA